MGIKRQYVKIDLKHLKGLVLKSKSPIATPSYIDYVSRAYFVSKGGNVYKILPNGKIFEIKLQRGLENCVYFSVTMNRIPLKVKAHRAVFYSFNPDVSGDLTINHIDGNRLNNDISNLEAITGKENTLHYHNVLSVGFNRKAIAIEMLVKNESVESIIEKTGFTERTVESIRLGLGLKKHQGFNRDKILALMKEGKRNCEIPAILGCGMNAIEVTRRLWRNSGFDPNSSLKKRNPAPVFKNSEIIIACARMLLDGVTITEISRSLKCNTGTVRNAQRKLDSGKITSEEISKLQKSEEQP